MAVGCYFLLSILKKRHFKFRAAFIVSPVVIDAQKMPTLPKQHTPDREAVASILSSAVHLDHLYGAHQIADILNAVVSDSNEKGIDTTVLLRAFPNDDADAFAIPLPHGVLYVRRTKTSRRHRGNDLAIGRFKTIKEGERAAVV